MIRRFVRNRKRYLSWPESTRGCLHVPSGIEDQKRTYEEPGIPEVFRLQACPTFRSSSFGTRCLSSRIVSAAEQKEKRYSCNNIIYHELINNWLLSSVVSESRTIANNDLYEDITEFEEPQLSRKRKGILVIILSIMNWLIIDCCHQ